MPLHRTTVIDRLCKREALMFEHENPPQKSGNDPIVVRAYELQRFTNVVIEVPNSSEINTVETAGPAGEYVHTSINGVDVHFRKGMKVVPGEVTVGDIVIYVKTWEPKTSDKSRNVHRNYSLCINVETVSNNNEPEQRLYISDTAARTYKRRFMDLSGPERYCHLSKDRSRNQDVQVLPLNKPTRLVDTTTTQSRESNPQHTQMAYAMREAGLV